MSKINKKPEKQQDILGYSEANETYSFADKVISPEDQKRLVFEEAIADIYKVYGSQSVLPILFGAGSIFRSEIISSIGSFPILLLSGPFTTGKSSLAYFLFITFSKESYNFKYKKDDNSFLIEGLCEEKIMILDDFVESQRINAFLKSNYDGAKFYIGRPGKKAKAESRENKASVIITSNKLPSDYTILNRTILVSSDKSRFSKEEMTSFDRLSANRRFKPFNDNCNKEIKEKVKDFESQFLVEYGNIKNYLIPFFRNDDRRLLDSYATLISVHSILKRYFQFPFTADQLIEAVKKAINKHEDACDLTVKQ